MSILCLPHVPLLQPSPGTQTGFAGTCNLRSWLLLTTAVMRRGELCRHTHIDTSGSEEQSHLEDFALFHPYFAYL